MLWRRGIVQNSCTLSCYSVRQHKVSLKKVHSLLCSVPRISAICLLNFYCSFPLRVEGDVHNVLSIFSPYSNTVKQVKQREEWLVQGYPVASIPEDRLKTGSPCFQAIALITLLLLMLVESIKRSHIQFCHLCLVLYVYSTLFSDLQDSVNAVA